MKMLNAYANKGFKSLMITCSMIGISFATRNPLAPRPDNPSRNIFGPSKFFKNDEYAMIEKSLFSFAFGLKNAGSFGGTFSFIEPDGTRNFVFPSIISINSVVCNSNS